MMLLLPDADEVFNTFLTNNSSKELKKSFGIEKEAITAAECVKEVEKSAFLFFHSQFSRKKKTSIEKELKPEKIDVLKLNDITFFSFSSEGVDANVWKGKDFVPMLKNLKEIRCRECNGKGFKSCNRCNDSRFITCEECNGKERSCDKCKGSGKIIFDLDVKEVNKRGDEKRKTEKKTYQCTSCFGTGKIVCKKCGGSGKIVCYECKGNPIVCPECKGFGKLYELHDSHVPIIYIPSRSKNSYSFMVKKDKWMLKEKDYNQKLEDAESYSISDPKKLNDKDLKELFGVISLDKDLKKCIDETKKTFENLSKDYDSGKSSEEPLKPISLVFLLRLVIETPKKKKFDIYALGTKKKYSIMTNRF
ncbi:MAG: hypothetical protein ACFFB5_02680 [Promethearchaeota archaeon]